MSTIDNIYKITSLTDVGRVRDHNEDSHLFCPDLGKDIWLNNNDIELDNISKYGALLIVADGMGGTNAGEVASAISIEAVKQYFTGNISEQILNNPLKIGDFLIQSVLFAQKSLRQHQINVPSTSGMGTTIVIAWILNENVYFSWVGDSRCYIFRDKSYKVLSKDHSVVQEYIDMGKIEESMAFNHPQKNLITQSLGSENEPVPEFNFFNLLPNDRLLLCSDGLNSMLRDNKILEIVSNNTDDRICCETLIEEANNAGGDDNTTVILFSMRKSQSFSIPLTSIEDSSKDIKHSKTEPQKRNKLFNWRNGIILLVLLVVIGGFYLTKKEIDKSNFDKNNVPQDTTSTIPLEVSKVDESVNGGKTEKEDNSKEDNGKGKKVDKEEVKKNKTTIQEKSTDNKMTEENEKMINGSNDKPKQESTENSDGKSIIDTPKGSKTQIDTSTPIPNDEGK